MFPQNYIGLTCEVKTFRNVSLIKATIKQAEDSNVVLWKFNEDTTYLSGGGLVKIHVDVGKKEKPVFRGTIVSCNRDFMVIEDVAPIVNYGSRRSFRVDVTIPAQIYQLPKENDKMQASLGPFPAVIKDVSLTGMLLETQSVFRLDTRLEIRSNFIGIGRQNFIAVVKRNFPTNNGQAYGVAFENIEEWQEKELCNFLFEEQRKDVRRRRGS